MDEAIVKITLNWFDYSVNYKENSIKFFNNIITDLKEGFLVIHYNELFGENLSFRTDKKDNPITDNDTPISLDYMSETRILTEEIKEMDNPIFNLKLPALDPLREVYLEDSTGELDYSS